MIDLLKNVWKIQDERYFKWVKIIRFVISGGTATVLNIGALYFFVHFLHIWYLWAAVLGYIFGTTASFILQKFWTFRNTSKENMHMQFIFFAAAGVLGIFVNTSLVYVSVECLHFHYLGAQILSGVVIALMNYFIYKELVFHATKTQRIFSFLDKHKIKFIFGSLLVLFLVLRLPGVHLPYHQDEMKTAVVMSEGGETLKGIHHPPLTQVFYRLAGETFSPYLYRVFPLIFSVFSLFLLFIFSKEFFGLNPAIWVSLVFSLSFYSVWSSLMLDTDGAILPFFFILSFYFYYKWKGRGYVWKNKWLALLVISLASGFLVKLSFIVPIGALILDFILEHRSRISKKYIIKGSLYLIGFILLSGFAMYVFRSFLTTFSFETMFAHALSFVNFGTRNYMQIAIQAIKAILYSSPLIILPLFLGSKEIFKKTRPFFLAVFLGVIFYFIIFDFSQGALDKYLMFFVIPLSVLSGLVFAESFNRKEEKTGRYIFYGILITGGLFLLNFVNHQVFSLYPKTDWFVSALHLKWNFLFPFTGGSGPLGFYMSFLFMFISFAVAFLAILLAFWKRGSRNAVLIFIFILGVVYNLVFAEELFFGKINGDSTTVLKESLNFIEKDIEVKKVITYSDSGAFELISMKKYTGRFYAVPGYEEGHKVLFEANKKDTSFLVVEIPKLWKPSFYSEFFSGCQKIFETNSGKISGFVYDCKKVKI